MNAAMLLAANDVNEQRRAQRTRDASFGVLEPRPVGEVQEGLEKGAVVLGIEEVLAMGEGRGGGGCYECV